MYLCDPGEDCNEMIPLMMKPSRPGSKHKRLRPAVKQSTYSSVMLFGLAGCGGGGEQGGDGSLGSYVPPPANYEPPVSVDLNFKVLEAELVQPYWTASLLMDAPERSVDPILERYSRVIEYSFPVVQPPYQQANVIGWQTANAVMQTAGREIFDRLEAYLNVSFIEVTDPLDMNVIAIGVSNQTETVGFAYFPNPDFEVGMDVFISDDYVAPRFVGSEITNLDYEIMLHEIYHALGLKHPFEADGDNTNVLGSREDTSTYTVMSYNLDPSTFAGDARVLDLMALTALYGVNPSYRLEDDTYEFSNSSGVFIVDGGGRDTVAYQGSQNVFVDLRSGGHSFIGSKSAYITSANQLTISNGSLIENATTGSGNDTIIGNALNNTLSSGGGDDRIFAGEGRDTVISGRGADVIDLSEDVQARDTVKFNGESTADGPDIIYGFTQGVSGDCLDLGDLLHLSFDFLPLISVTNVPELNIAAAVVRVVGVNLDTSDDVARELNTGSLTSLDLSGQLNSILVCADSQETGAEQRLYTASTMTGELTVDQLAVFQGNYLDIDMWSSANFTSVV